MSYITDHVSHRANRRVRRLAGRSGRCESNGKIATRLVRIQSGLLGDWKTVSDGVSEIRIDYGPGYRLYYTIRGQVIVILLCGSDKRGQDRAIKLAKRLVKDV